MANMGVGGPKKGLDYPKYNLDYNKIAADARAAVKPRKKEIWEPPLEALQKGGRTIKRGVGEAYDYLTKPAPKVTPVAKQVVNPITEEEKDQVKFLTPGDQKPMLELIRSEEVSGKQKSKKK